MTEASSFRADIQALRGWAVMLVLLDHFDLGPFSQGYLGVDIFFVISGFLITGHIAKDVLVGQFKFWTFYSRRMRRILPAAFVTVLVTVLLAPWFLASVEMQDFSAQVVGALTFFINFVLWGQTDYFAVSADMKPLLHMWSLAIEEQFYIVIPALLFLTPKRWWKFLIFGFLAASGIFCWYLLTVDITQAFYAPWSRAWELLIGSALALFVTYRLPSYALLPALAALIGIPAYATSFAHPGFDALVVCLATATVICVRSETFGAIARRCGLVVVGDISYSLYLVHWPIMAFLYNAHAGAEVALSYRLGGFALSFLLAWLMYRFVEQPFRSKGPIKIKEAATAGLLAGVIIGGQYGLTAQVSSSLADMIQPH